MAYSCVRVAFEIGHEALRRTKKTPDGFTHDWEVFVRGADNTEIQHFVEKVVFHLHTTFPKPKRAIKEPPYSVKESGYAGFIIPIEIYFKNKDEPKKVRFDYDLSLQTSGPPIKHVLRETFVFPNPPEDLRRRLIKGGGVGVVGAESAGQLIPSEKAVVVEDSSSKHLAPPIVGKPKLGGADTPKKHKLKDHKIEEPRVSSSFADLFGPPIQKTTKVSPDPKKSSSSSSPQISNKLPDKDKQSGKSSRPKDGLERSGSSKDRSREHEKSKEKSSSSKHSSPPSKPTPPPPLSAVKTDKDEGKKPSHEDGSKEPKSSSSGESNRNEKKKKDKRNKDEKSSKKDRHKEREHGEKKHLVEKVDKQDRADKTEKNDKLEKSVTENFDKLKKSEKIEKNNVKEIKDKERECGHSDKLLKDPVKVTEKSKEREKDKEKEREKEKDKEKEKDREKEKHCRGDKEKEKDKEKQRHKHKKKDKKDRKDDISGFKDREKERDKPAKKDDGHHRCESKDREKNGVSFESPPSITETPSRKKSRSPSPVVPSTVPRDKPPQRPLKKLLEQMTEHSSSDSELSAASPDEVVDSKSPLSAVKPENSMGAASKLVGIHKSSSVSGSKQKERSSSRKEKKERKDKEQGEKIEKDDANKKRKRKSSGKSKPEESEPTVKTSRIEDVKVEEEAVKGADEDVMDVDVKQEEVKKELCKSEDDDDGSGSCKEEFGVPPAPECFTPDYVSQLKDLQHKIMTLEDNTELQRVVQVIAETGQYEITKKTFDFDLCALDRRTVKRLQDFFTASS